MGNSAVKEHRLKNHPNREAKSTRGVHKSEQNMRSGNEYGMTDDESLIVM